MDYQFCGVFVLKERLYLVREEGVGGPRQIAMPLRELPLNLDARRLGEEVLSGLDDYREIGRQASGGEGLNRQLLSFVDEKSVAAFERKKKEVTVRREVMLGDVRLFGPRDEEMEVKDPEPEKLGEIIKNLLGLRRN